MTPDQHKAMAAASPVFVNIHALIGASQHHQHR